MTHNGNALTINHALLHQGMAVEFLHDASGAADA
jgi:hypothetical protein